MQGRAIGLHLENAGRHVDRRLDGVRQKARPLQLHAPRHLQVVELAAQGQVHARVAVRVTEGAAQKILEQLQPNLADDLQVGVFEAVQATQRHLAGAIALTVLAARRAASSLDGLGARLTARLSLARRGAAQALAGEHHAAHLDVATVAAKQDVALVVQPVALIFAVFVVLI